jgi:hypothetical protein
MKTIDAFCVYPERQYLRQLSNYVSRNLGLLQESDGSRLVMLPEFHCEEVLAKTIAVKAHLVQSEDLLIIQKFE